MNSIIAIFDIGKTNKKLLLFDEQYRIVDEQAVRFNTILDEDEDDCEDIAKLSSWIRDSLNALGRSESYELKAVNVAAYGASFVNINRSGELVTPLYDYLKPYPSELTQEFYEMVGGKDTFCAQTASPALGSLNSGLQLYRLKKLYPNIFTQVHYSLHLPQYLSSIMSGRHVNEITSIGCHTALWDFESQKYHPWVRGEGIAEKLPAIQSSDSIFNIKLEGHNILSGIGLHDSSSALIPYLTQFKQPFILLSTGTWNISLNPFNKSPLTPGQLAKDCLCYLDFNGNPVKASRLFSGNQHEIHVDRLAERFQVNHDQYKTIHFDPKFLSEIDQTPGLSSIFDTADLSRFKTYDEAYHHLISDLVSQQVIATKSVMEGGERLRRIFVDGGFSSNDVFMNLLARTFPELEVFAAAVPHATALGAAVVIHRHWNNNNQLPDLIELVRYSGKV